jgi:predicted secreted protein
MPYIDTVIGKDVLLYFLVNGIYQQAACATECSLNVYTNYVEITTRTNNAGQGTWRKLKPTDNYWDASVSGIQLLDTPLKFSDIRQMQVSLTPIYIQYAKVSQSGTRYENWFGRGVITSTEETSAVDDFATFDIKIEGDGVLRADFDATNLNQPIEMFYYYTATGLEGRSFPILDLQGYLINGRLYRDGLENDPSGNTTTNRPGTDVPIGMQYAWDSNTAFLTLSDDAPAPSPGERFTIPYTNSYSGCSLFIEGFRVALDSNNHFAFSWTGTGLPPAQLLFEYSANYGATWLTFTPDIDTLNLDNAVYNTSLDTAGHYIFQLTPICTNNTKGKASRAYWNAVFARIINNRTDGLIIEQFTYLLTALSGTVVDASDDDITQNRTVTSGLNPYSGNNMLVFYFSPTGVITPATLTIKDSSGKVIGSANIPNTNIITSINLGAPLPNEFTIILD